MAESFATLLRKHRIAAGFSQQALAERAGLSVDAIGTLERGTRHAPYNSTIDLLIAALGLDDDASRRLIEAAKPAKTGKPRAPGHATHNNLPRTLTNLVGRAGDVEAVLTLLERCKLVTIAGPGGIGKTRVAIEAGERYAEQRSCDAAFFDLSPITDGSLVVGAISAAFGAPESQDANSAGALLRYLRNRKLLLILDTCEHRIEDVASLSASILQGCPKIVILTTSREPLGIAGETIFRLPALTFPEHGRVTPGDAGSYSAVALFAERAKSVDPAFAIGEDNANAVADICRHLEGLPLAIELAAARLPAFGLPTLRALVSEHMMLKSAVRGVPDRQATLEATIGWSYDLLSEAQRILLNRLGSFSGSFSLEAAVGVCASDPLGVQDIPLLVASLVDKSLVSASFDTEPVRYRILDSVRTYALEQLESTDDRVALFRRHADWLVEKTAELSFPDLDNIRSALQWALSSSEEQDTLRAARIAGGLRVLLLRAGIAEYRFLSKSLIDRISRDRFPEIVAPLLAGFVQTCSGREKLAAIADSLPIFEHISDVRGLAHLHVERAHAFLELGRLDDGGKAAAEALHICEQHGLDGTPALVHALGTMAWAAQLQWRTSEGRAYATRGLNQIRGDEWSDRFWRAWLTSNVGGLEFNDGNVAQAVQRAEDALRMYPYDRGRLRDALRANLARLYLLEGRINEAAALARDVLSDWNQEHSALEAMLCLAAISAIRGRFEPAARVLGTVEWGLKRKEKWRGSAIDCAVDEFVGRTFRTGLSDGELDRLKAEGRNLTIDRAIDEVLRASDSAS